MRTLYKNLYDFIQAVGLMVEQLYRRAVKRAVRHNPRKGKTMEDEVRLEPTPDETPRADAEPVAEDPAGTTDAAEAETTAAAAEETAPENPAGMTDAAEAPELTGRPALVIITAAELAAMDARELPPIRKPETAPEEPEDEDEDEDNDADETEEEDEDDYDAELVVESQEEGQEKKPVMKAKLRGPYTMDAKKMANLFVHLADTGMLEYELKCRREKAAEKVALRCERDALRDFLEVTSAKKRNATLARQTTLGLLEELKRRERAHIFAKKLMAGKLTETEAKEYYDEPESRTRVFIGKEDEEIRVTVQYDDDVENTTAGTVYETDFSLLPCELLPDTLVGAVGTIPLVMKSGDSQYWIVCRDQAHDITYTTDFFTNGDDAVLEWNELMEGLRQGKKVRVYDLRSAREDVPPPGRKPPETCGCVRCRDPIADETVARSLEQIAKSDPDFNEKLEKEYHSKPGAPEWMEASALNVMCAALSNARLLIASQLGMWNECPAFKTLQGRISLAVLVNAAKSVLKTEEFLVERRDRLVQKIGRAWYESQPPKPESETKPE